MKEFMTESKRILDLMVNSIYTHKEVFLRELISNASDAIDKLYYASLSTDNGGSRDDYEIRLELDNTARTLTIIDNGVGMDETDLEKNLGTIAHSGSLEFKQNNKLENVDIIGQFGVGFYSSFMVADKVQVFTRKAGSETALKWESNGSDGYDIEPTQKDETGTKIVLYIKPNTEDDNYDDYISEYFIKNLVKKYSDYIRYPIKMNLTSHKAVEGKEEGEEVTELTTLNSMVPVWKKKKSELKDDEYNEFYKAKFHDYADPIKVISTNVEGAVSYNALIFVPKEAPYNFYSADFKRGLQLYSNGVLIMDSCPELVPECFSFVKGVVDSPDLSLNISREILQHTRVLKTIQSKLEKKIKSELSLLLEKDREKYEEFYKSFGLALKYGIYSSYGQNKELLADLLMFQSARENKLVTLKEYLDKNADKDINYICGSNIESLKKLPQVENAIEKGEDALLCVDNVDEFLFKIMLDYSGKKFVSLTSGVGDTKTDIIDSDKELLDKIATNLKGKVVKVVFSDSLKNNPVCLNTQGEISIEMQKVLNNIPNSNKVEAEKVLVINSTHPIADKLRSADNEKLAEYSQVLCDLALLLEGLEVEDVAELVRKVSILM